MLHFHFDLSEILITKKNQLLKTKKVKIKLNIRATYELKFNKYNLKKLYKSKIEYENNKYYFWINEKSINLNSDFLNRYILFIV